MGSKQVITRFFCDTWDRAHGAERAGGELPKNEYAEGWIVPCRCRAILCHAFAIAETTLIRSFTPSRVWNYFSLPADV